MVIAFVLLYHPTQTRVNDALPPPQLKKQEYHIARKPRADIPQAPKKEVVTAQAVTTPKPKPAPVRAKVTSKEALLTAAGIPSNEWSAVDYIFHKESTWRPAAVNELGCIGLGQSCPGGSGLRAECPDWRTDKLCQVKHFDKYAKRRYGGWTFAVAFWRTHGWW